jgi:Tfp pilus assembly protein PilF
VLGFVCDAPAGRVEPLAERGDAGADRDAARAWFERGCALDTEKATWEEAAEAYRRALALDPDYADAHCNLGSLLFNRNRRDEARACFERAVERVPRHVEAHLNLGALCEEEGADERALAHYRQALESDPLFPYAHVSMALIYEKLGLVRTSRVHWRRYLQLEPDGSWAALAAKRLEEAGC